MRSVLPQGYAPVRVISHTVILTLIKVVGDVILYAIFQPTAFSRGLVFANQILSVMALIDALLSCRRS
jgi:hypothetical protein